MTNNVFALPLCSAFPLLDYIAITMSEITEQETKSRIKNYEAEIEKRKDAIVGNQHANLRLRHFQHPEHVKIDPVHPTGNANMYSPTGYVPVPVHTKWNLPKKHASRLPNPAFHF